MMITVIRIATVIMIVVLITKMIGTNVTIVFVHHRCGHCHFNNNNIERLLADPRVHKEPIASLPQTS